MPNTVHIAGLSLVVCQLRILVSQFRVLRTGTLSEIRPDNMYQPLPHILKTKTMTQKLLLASLILINLISCKTNQKETVITGKVIGELPAEIIYTNPINGVCDFSFSQSVITDSLGNFNINLNIDSPIFIKLFAKSSLTYLEKEPIIIAESGKKYELIIDLNKDESNYSIESEKGKIQNYYNSLSRINPRSCVYSFGKDISDMTGLRTDIKEQKQKEISEITAFYENGEISEPVYQLLKLDREVYYGVALSTLASMNNVNFINNKAEVPDLVFDIWKEANSMVNLDSQNILSTNNIYDFLYLKFWYYIYTEIKYDNFVETREKFREENKGQTYTLSIANELFENEILEFFTAQYIISNSRRIKQKEGDNEFSSIVDKFKENYPNSLYNETLESAKENFK